MIVPAVACLLAVQALLSAPAPSANPNIRPDQREVRIKGVRLTGEAARRASLYGLCPVGLDTVELEVALTDDQGRPLTDEVEVVVNIAVFEQTKTNGCVLRVKDGCALVSFRPVNRLPEMAVDFHVKGAPTQPRFYATWRMPLVWPARVTATVPRRRADPDGKDAIPVVVRVYDERGRLLPNAPVEVRYSSPDNASPTATLNVRTGPDGAALVRLPPSRVPGLGTMQAVTNWVGSRQVWVRYGPGPLPDELGQPVSAGAKPKRATGTLSR